MKGNEGREEESFILLVKRCKRPSKWYSSHDDFIFAVMNKNIYFFLAVFCINTRLVDNFRPVSYVTCNHQVATFAIACLTSGARNLMKHVVSYHYRTREENFSFLFQMIILFRFFSSFSAFTCFSLVFTNWIIQIRCHWNFSTISLSLCSVYSSIFAIFPAWPNTNSISSSDHWQRRRRSKKKRET